MTLAFDAQPRVLVRAQAQRRSALQRRAEHQRRRLDQSCVAIGELDLSLRQVAGPLAAFQVVAAFGDEFATEFGDAAFGVARRSEVERDPVLRDEAIEAAAREVQRESGRIDVVALNATLERRLSLESTSASASKLAICTPA